MQRSQLPALLAIVVGLSLEPSVASACSRSMRHYSDREIKQMAERAVASATTIVDGEVIVPMARGPNLPEGVIPVAYIKVSHTWKGQVDDGIATVAFESYCDVPLEIKGQKVRILLDGAGIFTADQERNGWAAMVDQKDAFNREVDQKLGAPRPANFTNPGEPPPPVNRNH